MTNHLFKKISDAIEGRESRLFLETRAGFALTYAGMITLSGRYAEVDHIARNPLAGGLIPGTGGVRKLRWARDAEKTAAIF